MSDWAALFDPNTSALSLVARASVVYVGLVVMLRLFTFRHAGQMGVADLLLITLIASAVQDGMAQNAHTISSGLILAATIFSWSWFLDWLSARCRCWHGSRKPSRAASCAMDG